MSKNNCLMQSNESMDKRTIHKNKQTCISNILNTHNLNAYKTIRNIYNKSFMLLLILSMTYCKPNAIFYVTPKFSILPVPLEMTAYIIDEMLKKSEENVKFCDEIKKHQKILVCKNQIISQYKQINQKCLAHLFESLPDLKLLIDDKKKIYDKFHLQYKEETIRAINKTNENAYYYPNIYVTHKFIKDKLKQKYIEVAYHSILQLLNEIFQPITDENKDVLDILQEELKNLWLRKIVTDYLEKNHNKIDTKDLRIMHIRVDMNTYSDTDNIDDVIKSIINDNLAENMSNCYVLLEPLYFLHSWMSLSYDIDSKKFKEFAFKLVVTIFNIELVKLFPKINTNKSYINKCRFILRIDYTNDEFDAFCEKYAVDSEAKIKYNQLCLGMQNT